MPKRVSAILPRKRSVVAILAIILAASPARASQGESRDNGFVTRSGALLLMNGEPFRFGGANIDWLGLSSDTYYEPDVHYPSPAEVDDALATVVEMGGTVIRSHTLGISVGCPQCVQPAKGVVNEAAMRQIDFVLKRAADHKLKVIIPLVDVVGTNCHKRPDGTFPDAFYYGNMCEFLSWQGETDRDKFHTSATVMEDYKVYVAHFLNRVNTLTGVAYKDDPTILGWETCNSCGLRGKKDDLAKWVADIASYIKSIDSKHLVIDGSGLLRFSEPGAYTPPPAVDVLCSQYYPYWDRYYSKLTKRAPKSRLEAVRYDAATAAANDRPYLACEFGWDQANWATPDELKTFLDAMKTHPNIYGALFWNLEAHADDHGWMPVHGPAKPGLHTAEEDLTPGGDWWAFYYTGRDTRWNTASDMYARGQLLRDFGYEMSGRSTPALAIPASPVITATDRGLVRWRGSVGAKTYSVEVATSKNGPWSVGCDRCASDDNGQWQDPALYNRRSWYRVVPYNPDGAAGKASAPMVRRAP